MIQDTCESAIPIVEFLQFLKTQRGYVAERIKSTKTSAERGPFLGALKILDLVERSMSHFSRITLPKRSPALMPKGPPESLEDLGQHLIQHLGLPSEFPLACFGDEEWRADLGKYLPGKARAIAEVGRLASDEELASHLLEIFWEPKGHSAVQVSSPQMCPTLQPIPPPFPSFLQPGGNTSAPGSLPLSITTQHAPARGLIQRPQASAKAVECPHCHRAFTNAGAMKSHAKACARFMPPASQGPIMAGDSDAVRVLVDGKGRGRFNGQRYFLGKMFASQQVIARLDGNEVVFSTMEGTQIKRFSILGVKSNPAIKKHPPDPASPSRTSREPPAPKKQIPANMRLGDLEDKRCPHCRRLFGNVGAMKAHAKSCAKAIKPEKFIQIAKENLPVPATTAHVNVTAHKVAASDRPWDGETFENTGDADHFAGEAYDEKFLHRTGGKKHARIPPSTLAERILAGDAFKIPVKVQDVGK